MEEHRKAHSGYRIISSIFDVITVLIHALLTGTGLYIFFWMKGASPDHSLRFGILFGVFFWPVAIALSELFCATSPGKWFMNLRIGVRDQRRYAFFRRFIRCVIKFGLFILLWVDVFFGFTWGATRDPMIGHLFESFTLAYGVFTLISFFFCVTPDRLALYDYFSGTAVYVEERDEG